MFQLIILRNLFLTLYPILKVNIRCKILGHCQMAYWQSIWCEPYDGKLSCTVLRVFYFVRGNLP